MDIKILIFKYSNIKIFRYSNIKILIFKYSGF